MPETNVSEMSPELIAAIKQHGDEAIKQMNIDISKLTKEKSDVTTSLASAKAELEDTVNQVQRLKEELASTTTAIAQGKKDYADYKAGLDAQMDKRDAESNAKSDASDKRVAASEVAVQKAQAATASHLAQVATTEAKAVAFLKKVQDLIEELTPKTGEPEKKEK